MKKEEYLKTISDIDRRMDELRDERETATNQYIDANKIYSVGERVKVTDKNGVVRFAECSDIKLGYFDKDKFNYEFNKVKKDGKVSSVRDRIWNGETISKLS